MCRTIGLLVLAAASLSSPAASAQTPDSAATYTVLSACREFVASFQTEMKSKLGAAMKEGGAEQAINTCQITAPAVLARYSRLEGWSIARTAQRLCNPLNKPDPFAADAMARMAADSLNEYHAWTVDSSGQQRLRYVAAIRMRAACAGCHGDRGKLSGAVLSAMSELYPLNKAFNFKPGELRGAFDVTVAWPQGHAVADSLVMAATRKE